MSTFSGEELVRRIDRTLFAADATRRDLEELCAEALEHSLHGVAVNTSRVELACAILDESDVKVIALVGFPLGASDADVKRYEVETAVDHGAQEIDFVLNLGRLKEADHRYVLREMRDIAEAADERPVNVILEMALLTREEIVSACELALDSGVRSVGTATDFHCRPVTVEDVRLLRECVGDSFGVKAAGGIEDVATAMALLEAGATRVGVSRKGFLI